MVCRIVLYLKVLYLDFSLYFPNVGWVYIENNSTL